MEEFTELGEAVLWKAVCSSLPQEEVERRVGGIFCGTSGGWKLSDKPFNDETPNPCPCSEAPETHKHYLFSC
ncbi:hypothetical protein LCGC14_1437000 [marine sediment metagenome]|uniref:Uncharacterized protein n=1 Tax=marine sediment metagenome TaxID=412755 RepID=A0A0F9M2E5_9ZZZZ